MKLPYLPRFLRSFNPITVGRGFAAIFVAGSIVWAIVFVSKAVEVVFDGPEVSLVLNSHAAQQYSTGGAAKPQDFVAGKPTGGRLAAPLLNASSFELSTDPQTLLIRYRGPNPWKRLALFFPGASEHELLSLPAVLYFVLGSILLWLLLLDVTPETPFTNLNTQRLRKLALLVLVLTLLKHPAHYAVQALVPVFNATGLAESLNHYVRLNTEDTLPGAEIGIMLLVIAAVYRRGVELSREAEFII